MWCLRSFHLLLSSSLVTAATVNSGYFSFPLKSDAVPTVHNGDVLNVTWVSNYEQAVLYFWCGLEKMNRFDGLTGSGQMTFTVNTSWSSPCHWQYAKQADEANFMDSGFVDVTNSKATPAVTWQPSRAGVACGIQSATTTAVSTHFITATTSATSSAATNIPILNNTQECASEADKPMLSTGASMGVGIAIGAAIAGVTSGIWFFLRMRVLRRREKGMSHGSPPGDSANSLHELHYSFRPVEADVPMAPRRRIDVAELPPDTASPK